MPFTLAHPAAVLPLRRCCPKWLSFPALVAGSLSPDAGYLFLRGDVGAFSHAFLGSFAFCLPIAGLMLGLFYALRAPIVCALPTNYRQALLPLCGRPTVSPWGLAFSLLLGIWSHLFWDSFTHNEGWFVQHWSVLQAPVISFHGRTARVCHLLWYGCSFAGVGWLFVVFERWKQSCVGRAAGTPLKAMVRDAALAAILVLPIQLVHHLVRGGLALVLMAAWAALLVAGVAVRVARER